jgi:hypothetical protein
MKVRDFIALEVNKMGPIIKQEFGFDWIIIIIIIIIFLKNYFIKTKN